MHHDIIIIGGGAGGLELAAKLGRKLGRREGPERVLLIDRSPFHIWKPSLHEVATGTLNPQQEGLSYSILARDNYFSFIPGELIAFDPKAKKLCLKAVTQANGVEIIPERKFSFNRCVIAIGSGSNFFNTKGQENAFVLENAQDAQNFQNHLLNLFARASYSEPKQLNVAIIGAGATGVELSAELMDAYREIQYNSGSTQRFLINISLIEAAPRILSTLPEKVSNQATKALYRKQIKTMINTKVIALESDRVITDKGDIPADVIVWAAGIKAAENNKNFGLPINELNQFKVNQQLQTPFEGVYAMGDCSACEWENGKNIPARAAAAHQQAQFLFKLLLAYCESRVFNGEFKYKDSGTLVSLGNNNGVGNISHHFKGGSLLIHGLLAKYAHVSLHLMHHATILGCGKTILLALARLAQRRVQGKLKLH